MKVNSLDLLNYRNYEQLHMEPDAGINLIFGDNAQGKTNVLEAIYQCAASHSHRGAKDRDVIRFGEQEAHIRLVMEKGGTAGKIDLHLRKDKNRGIALDGIPIRKASELLGRLHAVFFSPEDLKIIKNSPLERRRFLDSELCQLSPLYTAALINYNKALLQRGELLKSLASGRGDEALLEVWDSQLVHYGAEVIRERQIFTENLQEIVAPLHYRLSGGREELKVVYAPSSDAEHFAEKLFLAGDIDRHQCITSVGPHRDEMEFYIGGRDVKRFGSQGQQRTAALSLKLAEIELVKQRLKDTPILLLDDVLSELDANRQEVLLMSLDRVQTFLTCTGLDDFVTNCLQAGRRYCVTEGKMKEV